MTFTRAYAFGQSVLASLLALILVAQTGSSSTRFALMVGLGCSAVLVLVRVGAAAGASPFSP
ncbi:hypothetical protein [Enhydrobacter aerosaccus]|nr:hypothetical protein [Enhydrobacter aerosaccus]